MGWWRVGMGFSIDAVGSEAETLFVSNHSDPRSPMASTLGKLDASGKLAVLAPVTGGPYTDLNAELTGPAETALVRTRSDPQSGFPGRSETEKNLVLTLPSIGGHDLTHTGVPGFREQSQQDIAGGEFLPPPLPPGPVPSPTPTPARPTAPGPCGTVRNGNSRYPATPGSADCCVAALMPYQLSMTLIFGLRSRP